MAKLTRSITINAPVEKVFDLAMNIGRLWPCSPEVAVRDVELTPDGVGTKARIWTHGLGVHFEGNIEYTEVVRPERIVAQVAFGLEKPVWVFTFEPAGADTKMTGQGEWHVNAPAVGKALEQWMAKSHEGFLETMLANFKTEAESESAAA
ncbi:MAG: SRPBCC family protein [Candidatus Nanopelagicales bacterium]